jgi:hypothetical protein
MRIARAMDLSPDAMAVTATTWSPSVAWRMPSRNPMASAERKEAVTPAK